MSIECISYLAIPPHNEYNSSINHVVARNCRHPLLVYTKITLCKTVKSGCPLI